MKKSVLIRVFAERISTIRVLCAFQLHRTEIHTQNRNSHTVPQNAITEQICIPSLINFMK